MAERRGTRPSFESAERRRHGSVSPTPGPRHKEHTRFGAAPPIAGAVFNQTTAATACTQLPSQLNEPMAPPRPIAAALWSFWSQGQRTERTAYVVGTLLLVSGLVHLALLVVTGASWEGPLSLRKASTFGLSFGIR